MARSLRRKESNAPVRLIPAHIKRQIEKLASCNTWPIHQAFVSENWQSSLLAQVLVARMRPDRNIALAVFLADLGCLGLKSAIIRSCMTVAQYEDTLEVFNNTSEIVACDPALAAKIIDKSIDYAASFGFQPRDPTFDAAKLMLRGIDPATCHVPVRCGREGKPVYVSGPYDDTAEIMQQLTARVGPYGFEFVDGSQFMGPHDAFSAGGGDEDM